MNPNFVYSSKFQYRLQYTHPIWLRLYQKNAKFLESGHIQNYTLSGNRFVSNMYALCYQKEQLLTILGDITCMEMVLRGENRISLWAPLIGKVKLLRPKSNSPDKPIQEHKGQILLSVFLFTIPSKLRNRVSEDGISLYPTSLNSSQYSGFLSAVSRFLFFVCVHLLPGEVLDPHLWRSRKTGVHRG